MNKQEIQQKYMDNKYQKNFIIFLIIFLALGAFSLAQAESDLREEINAKYLKLHDELSYKYYQQHSLTKEEFDALHQQLWRDHDTELKEAGLIEEEPKPEPAFDIAETYLTLDSDIEEGDIMAIATEFQNPNPEVPIYVVEKSKEPYQGNLIGIISGHPAMVLGGQEVPEGLKSQPVALAGRVLVKVYLESGAIEVGDYLAASSQPGVAMKAIEPGRVIGMALEPYDSEEIGKIMVFLNLGWYSGPSLASDELTGGGLTSDSGSFADFVQKVKQALASLGLFIENGIAQVRELIAEKIFTEEITAKRIRMIDKATGEIYCTWIENGEWVKVKGECQNMNYELGIMNQEPEGAPEELVCQPTEEVCDGIDNDCDNEIDEGGVCELAEPPAEDVCDATHLNLCLTETDCTNAEGFWYNEGCNLEPETPVCQPTEEVCDGIDNDCDGLIDEDLGQTTCGIGVCEVTIENCLDGVSQTCTPGMPTEEICDGVDNNCDGQIDEGGVCETPEEPEE